MSREYVDGLVSVITPVYNAERYLRKTLDSVFQQTYKNIEIVLVDDCSKDNSAAIIADLKEEHQEIVYHLQKTNMGAGVARNKALELARGRYVAFLDSDDLWLPEKIERQLKLMQEKDCPFAYAAIEMMDEHGNQLKGKREIRETCDYNYLLHNTVIATSSVVVDREALGDFRMPLRRGGQDYATWLMLLRNGVVARGINEVLVRYRVGRNSLSSNKFKSIKQVWEIQTQDEGISYLYVVYNLICWTINVLRKYFL